MLQFEVPGWALGVQVCWHYGHWGLTNVGGELRRLCVPHHLHIRMAVSIVLVIVHFSLVDGS